MAFYRFYLIPTDDISFIMNENDDRYVGLMLPYACPCFPEPELECLHDCVMINILEKIKACKESNSFCDAEKEGGDANCQDIALAIYTHMADLGVDRSCNTVLNDNLVKFFEDGSVLYMYEAFLEEMKNIKPNNICVIDKRFNDQTFCVHFFLFCLLLIQKELSRKLTPKTKNGQQNQK